MRTSSQPGFRARTSASPEPAPGLPDLVQDSGGKWFEPFAWFDRAGHCWKTWQLCLDGEWEPFWETWPRSGMTRNGIAYRRQPLVRLTDEIGSGLLPTPEASNTKAVALRSAGRSPRNWLASLPTSTATMGDRGGRSDLIQVVRGNASPSGHFRLPTPTASEHKYRLQGNSQQSKSLGAMAARGIWSTPVADDTGHRKGKYPQGGTALSTQAGGQLNPTWIEWLMGFPLGWTALPPLATPSSRKSRKRSAARSSPA